MRRIAAWALTLLLLLLPLGRVFAYQYTDAENLLAVTVPDDESTLYYTEDEAYLPEDMQTLADSHDLDARLLVRSYTPQDILGYTLDVISCPLHALDGSAAPSVGRAEGYTDITQSAIRDTALDLVREMYGSRFTLGAAEAGSFRGVPDLELTGSGRTDSHWTDYDLDVYLLTNSERLIIIAAAFLDSQQAAVEDLLDTFVFGTEPAAQQAAAPAATEPPPSPEQTQTAAATEQASAPAVQSPAAGSASPAWWAAVQAFLKEHPNWPYYMLLAAAAAVLVAGLIIYLRAVRHRRWILEDEDDAHPGMPPAAGRRSRRNAGRHGNKEDRMGVSERPSRTGRPEYDYAEDISRYTQQPSADVNDVSRYTHGYDEEDSLSNALQALQDEPLVTPPPVRIQSVGSRMERHHRKKRK